MTLPDVNLIGHQTLQASVLDFQILQTTNLVDFHTAVFLAPAVIGLLTDTQCTYRLQDCLALRDAYLSLAKVSDDLLCRITLSGHVAPFLCPYPNFRTGNNPGGHATTA